MLRLSDTGMKRHVKLIFYFLIIISQNGIY